jgi:hypothetical protein
LTCDSNRQPLALLIGAVGVDAWLWWCDPALRYHCGLSGITITQVRQAPSVSAHTACTALLSSCLAGDCDALPSAAITAISDALTVS